MPSKRIRSKKSVAASLASMNQIVTRTEQISTPYALADGAVLDGSIDLGAITGASFSDGSISSRALSLSAYTPNGEANQRVPAPLDNLEYWTDVIFGLNELHRSGIHDNEDIQNVTASTAGISFTSTGVVGGESRIYLTGRLNVPKSKKLYATWESSAPIPVKVVYWNTAEKFLVDELEIVNGVVTAVTRTPHGFSAGTTSVATTNTYQVTSGGGSGTTPNTLTITTVSAHGLATGNPISISGTTINGNYDYTTVLTTTKFTVQTALSVIGSTAITETINRLADTIKITNCGPYYDGIVTILSVDTDSFTYSIPTGAPSNSAKTYLSIGGRASVETFTYVPLEDRISLDIPEVAGEYAVYAELDYATTDTRILKSAKVFEIIGSGAAPIVTANVTSKSITANIATLTTSANHGFFKDDAIKISGIIDVATTSSYQVSAGGGSGSTPNTMLVTTTTNHGFTSTAPISISGSPTTINGDYAIATVPLATTFTVQTALAAIGTTSITATVTRAGSVFNGQALVTATTNNTFSYARTVTGGSYPATAVSPEGLAEVGNPRYSYINAIQTSVPSTYIRIYTFESHGFATGETVKISGVSILDPLYQGIDGEYVVSASSTDTVIQFDLPIEPAAIPYTVLPTQAAIAYSGTSDMKVESGPDGFRFISTGAGDSVSTDLGTSADNFLGVTRLDGKSVASIDEFGIGTFSGVVSTTVSAAEVSVDGVALVGNFATAKYNDNDYSGALFERLARGLIYQGTFYIDSATTINKQYYTLAHGTFSVEDGRHYQITAATNGLRASPSINAIFELLMSTEPLNSEGDFNAPRHMGQLMADTVASSFAPLIGTYSATAVTAPTTLAINTLVRTVGNANVVVNTTTAHGLNVKDFVGIDITGSTVNTIEGTYMVTAISPPNQFTYESSDTAAYSSSSGTVRKVDPLLSQVGKLPAGVPIRWLLRLRHGGTPSYGITTNFGHPNTSTVIYPQHMELSVIDIGQAKTAVDVTKVGVAGVLSLETTPSSGTGTSGTTTTTYTKTQTVSASDSAYYDNYGKGTGTSDPYAYRYSLYQGDPGLASGVKKAAVLFPKFTAIPAGATAITVTKVEVYLRNRHSYNSGGLTAYLGIHSVSTLGSSIPAVDNVGVVTSAFTKGQGKWVTLPSGSYTSFKPDLLPSTTNQTARGIILGATDDNPDNYYAALANYGYFDGNTMSDEPQLRVTYTYKL